MSRAAGPGPAPSPSLSRPPAPGLRRFPSPRVPTSAATMRLPPALLPPARSPPTGSAARIFPARLGMSFSCPGPFS